MKKLVSIILSISIIAAMSSVALADDAIQPRYDNTAYSYYCVGRGLSNLNKYIDCSEEADTVSTYTQKWGYFPESYENPVLKELSDGRINSIITLFAGHGNGDYVNTGDTSGISLSGRTGFKDINKLKFNSTEISVLAACESAAIADAVCLRGERGKTCTLSCIDSPNTLSMTRYIEGLDQGKTYQQAKEYAEKSLKNKYGVLAGDPILTDTLYGASENTVTKLDYRSNNKEVSTLFDLYYKGEENQYPINGELTRDPNSEDYSLLEKYIKENINPEFNISDYIVENYYGEDTKFEDVTFYYKVGDLRSSFGYSVLSENGKVFLIEELGTPISTKERALITLPEPLTEQEIFDMAVKNDNIVGNTEDVLVEQSMYKFFDSTEKKVKYVVNTVYMHMIDGEEFGKYAIGFEYFQ